jgi:O-antigen ligase
LVRALVLGALIAVAYELGALALGRSSLALLSYDRALGGMLGMLIPFSLTLFLVERRLAWKGAVFGSLCLMGAALVLTSTRGAWAGCLVGMTFVGIVADKRAVGVVLLAVLFFFLLSPRTQVRRAFNTFDSADRTITKRAHLWRSGLRMAQENPLFGKGPGSYKEMYRSYLSSEGRELVRPDHAHAHNIFIHTLAETGIVGLCALLLVLVGIARWLWRLQRRLGDLLLKTMVAGLIGGLLGFLVHGQVDYTLAGRTGFLFWFYLGLAFQCNRLSRGD